MNSKHSMEESFTSDLTRSIEGATTDFVEAQECQVIDQLQQVVNEGIDHFYNNCALTSLTNHDHYFNQFEYNTAMYCEEAFNMQQLLQNTSLEGGISIDPSLASLVSLDLQKPLSQLSMYTENMEQLAAPYELCIQKALELINCRTHYEISVEAFRMELLADYIDEEGIREVNALIKGITCISQFILNYFDNAFHKHVEMFPYEMYCLHQHRYLFLTKIVLDAKLSTPIFNPSTVAKPAYTYSEVQSSVRENHSSQAYFCPTVPVYC